MLKIPASAAEILIETLLSPTTPLHLRARAFIQNINLQQASYERSLQIVEKDRNEERLLQYFTLSLIMRDFTHWPLEMWS